MKVYRPSSPPQPVAVVGVARHRGAQGEPDQPPQLSINPVKSNQPATGLQFPPTHPPPALSCHEAKSHTQWLHLLARSTDRGRSRKQEENQQAGVERQTAGAVDTNQTPSFLFCLSPLPPAHLCHLYKPVQSTTRPLSFDLCSAAASRRWVSLAT